MVWILLGYLTFVVVVVQRSARQGCMSPAYYIFLEADMLMNSRVWLALSPEAREQYRNWFGVIDMNYEDAPRPQHPEVKVPRKPRRRVQA